MSDERFTIKSTATELELYDTDVQIGEFTHHEWVARSVTYVVDLLNKLHNENEQLRKERDYWEQSSKHRQRLLENAEKELRLHNAYLVDKGIAEDYTRWKRRE